MRPIHLLWASQARSLFLGARGVSDAADRAALRVGLDADCKYTARSSTTGGGESCRTMAVRRSWVNVLLIAGSVILCTVAAEFVVRQLDAAEGDGGASRHL